MGGSFSQHSTLTLDGVSVHRGPTEVLRGLQWHVRRGENWAVVGPNGAGKSSLAAAITGQAAVSGDIAYGFDSNGADPTERIASVSFQLQRQFVAQSDGYYQSRWYLGEEHATLTAAVALGLTENCAPPARRGILSVARHMGLGRLLDRQTLHLSTGEMRRLLIARALLLAPALLVLDEPFIGLDIKGRATLAKALSAILRQGQQALFLTARPWEIPRAFTHALYLRDGGVVGTARRNSTNAHKLESLAFRTKRSLGLPMSTSIRRKRVHGKPIVELRQVCVNAGGIPILDRLDWTVRAGEHWAVLGPNGAGKTTLLSLLTGDHPQSYAQHVSIFGVERRAQSTWSLKAQIGYAAPDIALHYDGSTRMLDFVCTGFFETLGLYRRCTQRQTRMAWTWLEYFGLKRLASRPFRLLSDGHQRLALLARAIIKQPRLLILDEPCQGLDRISRERVCSALDALCSRTSTTLIIVSHYVEELPRCITHRLHLSRGKRGTGETMKTGDRLSIPQAKRIST